MIYLLVYIVIALVIPIIFGYYGLEDLESQEKYNTPPAGMAGFLWIFILPIWGMMNLSKIGEYLAKRNKK